MALVKWNGKTVQRNLEWKHWFQQGKPDRCGINQPLKIAESALDFAGGRRIARVMRVEAFGNVDWKH
jgi:hypothetical protein